MIACCIAIPPYVYADTAAGEPAASPAQESPVDPSIPIEWGRILSEEDFARIRELRHEYALVFSLISLLHGRRKAPAIVCSIMYVSLYQV